MGQPMETLPQILRPLGSLEKAIQQGPQVQTGSPHDQWHLFPRLNFREQLPSLGHEVPGGKDGVRFEEIQQMMGDSGLFL